MTEDQSMLMNFQDCLNNSCVCPAAPRSSSPSWHPVHPPIDLYHQAPNTPQLPFVDPLLLLNGEAYRHPVNRCSLFPSPPSHLHTDTQFRIPTCSTVFPILLRYGLLAYLHSMLLSLAHSARTIYCLGILRIAISTSLCSIFLMLTG